MTEEKAGEYHTAYFDGSRGTRGYVGIGYVILGPDGQKIEKGSEFVRGKAHCEEHAFLHLITRLDALQLKRVHVFGDAKGIIEQACLRAKRRRPIMQQCAAIIEQHPGWKFEMDSASTE